MSKSRLEKFLYALYSLDSSDLPNPLSRIEELYNCLVTGDEVPTFEPLSRVEKYLMAILGVYDVNELPNPLSRVEALLYKLAIGDDNLDDIESFLSRHEELLVEIIRNGGISFDDDYEYMGYSFATQQYTLENTAEQPVKSAVLKGQTLVNIVNNDNWVRLTGNDKNLFIQNISIKKDQTYTVIGKFEIGDILESVSTANEPAFRIRTGTGNSGTSLFYIQRKNDVVFKQTFTNNENNTINIRFFNQKTNYKKLMIIEGDYTNVDIPYFEGMQSVKMPVLTTTGKNLFDLERFKKHQDVLEVVDNGVIITHAKRDITHLMNINFKPNTQYYFSLNREIISGSGNFFFEVSYSDGSNELIGWAGVSSPNKTIVKLWTSFSTHGTSKITNIQIEEGKSGTSYESHKSNILTVNEEVELRGIDDVKDELNLLTGEATQRIGKLVFDGSEDEEWLRNPQNDGGNTAVFYIGVLFNNKPKVIMDKFTPCPSNIDNFWVPYLNDMENHLNDSNDLAIRISKSKLSSIDESGFRQWLSQNPVTVQYILMTESVKTVDLSIVDQDGDNTKLSTFDDITHVTLSSEGLIPEAEMEVATKNEEVLSTLSLEMDDISTAQTTLEETSNAQSENVDATMIATTEIYEELL